MDEFRRSKAKFSREWRSRGLMPTTDRFVRADGDEPRAVGRISELRDSAAVSDIVAQHAAVAEVEYLNVPQAIFAKVCEGQRSAGRVKRERRDGEAKGRGRSF